MAVAPAIHSKPCTVHLQVAELERAEHNKMKEKVQAIMNQGINCFCNRQLIYNHAEEMFADADIAAIEHVDFDGTERLALVTGKPAATCVKHLWLPAACPRCSSDLRLRQATLRQMSPYALRLGLISTHLISRCEPGTLSGCLLIAGLPSLPHSQSSLEHSNKLLHALLQTLWSPEPFSSCTRGHMVHAPSRCKHVPAAQAGRGFRAPQTSNPSGSVHI